MTHLAESDREQAPGWWFALLLLGEGVLLLFAAVGLYTMMGWLVPPASALHWMLCALGVCVMVIWMGVLFWLVTEP